MDSMEKVRGLVSEGDIDSAWEVLTSSEMLAEFRRIDPEHGGKLLRQLLYELISLDGMWPAHLCAACTTAASEGLWWVASILAESLLAEYECDPNQSSELTPCAMETLSIVLRDPELWQGIEEADEEREGVDDHLAPVLAPITGDEGFLPDAARMRSYRVMAESARDGDANALGEILRCFFKDHDEWGGRAVERIFNYVSGVGYALMRAWIGDPLAQGVIARHLYWGDFDYESGPAAERWMLIAGEGGNRGALWSLARLYDCRGHKIDTRGVTGPNPEAAIRVAQRIGGEDGESLLREYEVIGWMRGRTFNGTVACVLSVDWEALDEAARMCLRKNSEGGAGCDGSVEESMRRLDEALSVRFETLRSELMDRFRYNIS